MKNKKILVYSLVLLLVLSIIGITYAYFSTKISGNTSAKNFTAISKVIKIEYSDGTEKLTSNDNLFKPGSIIEKKFTVTNTGDDDIDYTIYLENVTNTFNRVNDITYELYDSSNNKIYEGIFPKIDNIISDTYKLKKNESTSYTLKVIYNNSEENQIEDSGKKIDAKISFVGATLKSTLLNSAKEASASSSTTRTTLGTEVTTFTSISGANEHVLNTAPDDYGTSYYFRGNVIDNYVEFGNLTYKDDVVVGYESEDSDSRGRYSSLSKCESDSYNVTCTLVHKSGEPILWRIVRINGDGTIRLVLDDFASSTFFNYMTDDNAYVGYMYGTAGSTTYQATHENKDESVENESVEKQDIDKWYEDNLKTNYANYLSDTLFCGDKTLAKNGIGGVTTQLGYGTNKTYYSSTERLLYSSGTTTITTLTPTLKCAENANDNYSRYTTTKNILPDGKETNGNLKYPIGLLSADEVAYAGASTKINTTYYLTNPSITTSWPLLTPSYYDNEALIWGVSILGNVYPTYSLNYSVGFRPVINLKAQVLINGGDGTQENPYTVKLS